MGKGEVKLKDVKLEGDTLTLTRQVGEFATEQITAKRSPPAES